MQGQETWIELGKHGLSGTMSVVMVVAIACLRMGCRSHYMQQKHKARSSEQQARWQDTTAVADLLERVMVSAASHR